eukprot:3149708-Rhodomonas_salina.1
MAYCIRYGVRYATAYAVAAYHTRIAYLGVDHTRSYGLCPASERGKEREKEREREGKREGGKERESTESNTPQFNTPRFWYCWGGS